MSKRSQDWHCDQCGGITVHSVGSTLVGPSEFYEALGVRAYRRARSCENASEHDDYLPIYTFEFHENDINKLKAEINSLRKENGGLRTENAEMRSEVEALRKFRDEVSGSLVKLQSTG